MWLTDLILVSRHRQPAWNWTPPRHMHIFPRRVSGGRLPRYDNRKRFFNPLSRLSVRLTQPPFFAFGRPPPPSPSKWWHHLNIAPKCKYELRNGKGLNETNSHKTRKSTTVCLGSMGDDGTISNIEALLWRKDPCAFCFWIHETEDVWSHLVSSFLGFCKMVIHGPLADHK